MLLNIHGHTNAKKFPDKVHDMLGYQALIVEARMEYEGDRWLGYDRHFRQTAAASLDTPWAKIESTLWNKAFAGQAGAARCKYCFSLTHAVDDCGWAPTPSTSCSNKQGGLSSGRRPTLHRFFTSGTTTLPQCAPSRTASISMPVGIAAVIHDVPQSDVLPRAPTPTVSRSTCLGPAPSFNELPAIPAILTSQSVDGLSLEDSYGSENCIISNT